MTDERIRLLIADDHPVFRGGLKLLLDSLEGVELVGEAGNGEEAIALAREQQPDVVLMDLHMPGVNGIEATRQIVAESPHIGVLVLTMFQDDDSVFAAMRAGAKGYLLKGAGQEEIAIRFDGEGKLDLFDGVWSQRFGTGYTKIDRSDYNDPDAFSSSSSSTTNEGTRTRFDWQNDVRAADWMTLTAGADTEKEQFESRGNGVSTSGDSRTNGVFVRTGWNYYPWVCPVTGESRWSGRVGNNTQFYWWDGSPCYRDADVATDGRQARKHPHIICELLSLTRNGSSSSPAVGLATGRLARSKSSGGRHLRARDEGSSRPAGAGPRPAHRQPQGPVHRACALGEEQRLCEPARRWRGDPHAQVAAPRPLPRT